MKFRKIIIEKPGVYCVAFGRYNVFKQFSDCWTNWSTKERWKTMYKTIVWSACKVMRG